MLKLQAVIFDLDGTLVDSAPDITQAVNATMRDYGRREFSSDEVKQMLGDGLRVTLERAMQASGSRDADIGGWMKTFTRHYYALMPANEQVYPHVIEVLTQLKAAGLKLGICTNKLADSTLRLITHLKLHDFFDAVAGADTFPVRKPDPGHVLGVARMLDVPPAACVMVGDSPNDVLAAKGAGVPVIVVAHGYGEGMEAFGADAIIGGFGELLAALKMLGQAI